MSRQNQVRYALRRPDCEPIAWDVLSDATGNHCAVSCRMNRTAASNFASLRQTITVKRCSFNLD